MEKIRFNTLTSRLLLLLGILSVMASCKKDDDDEVSPEKKKDLLIKTWEIKEVVYNGTILPSENNPLIGQRYEFKKDGTYRISQGSQSSEEGKWEMNENGDRITFDKGTDDELEAKILQLDKSTLNLELSGYTEKNGQVTLELRMK